jgi:hypothetical protein
MSLNFLSYMACDYFFFAFYFLRTVKIIKKTAEISRLALSNFVKNYPTYGSSNAYILSHGQISIE